ncbi:MAG: DUF4833 domain-containing protein [Cyclobacteriaceae bacterium]|nr:DUF4833 domain-containing protein [Cyclobacteriaceae bacterium]
MNRTKFILFGSLLFLISGWSFSEFPVPPHSANTLFYIQRSNNANTVMYEINRQTPTSIQEKDPVHVYWIRYAEKGQRRDLNYIERTLAYGVRCEPLSKNTFTLRFVASKTRVAEIFLNEKGQATAHMLINNKKSTLRKIFVQVTETGWLIPKVDYVEFFGTDTETLQPTYEKMII